MNTIQIVLKKPGFEPVKMRVENSLANLQALVDGPIEVIAIDDGILMIVNEEGKLRGLAPNFMYGKDMIVGTAFFCGLDEDEFVDLSDENAYDIMMQFEPTEELENV